MAPLATCCGGGADGAKLGAYSAECAGPLPPPMQALRSTRLASAQKADFMAGSELLVDILQHFVGCGNHLAVHFVGALCLDHVDQFLDDIDVRSFKRALADRTSAFQTSGSRSEEHTSELQSLMRISYAV